MRKSTSGCKIETLDARRMFSATLSDAFALEPSYDPVGAYERFASDQAGTFVRGLGYGKIAIHTGFDSQNPGAGIERQLDVPYIGSMALNDRGELAVAWEKTGALKGGIRPGELMVRVFKLGSGGTVSPVTSAISISSVRNSSHIEQPDVAIDGNGHVTVAWSQWDASTDFNILTKRLVRQATGSYTAQKTVTVNTQLPGNQWEPQIAMQRSGEAVVGWANWTSNSAPYSFCTQRFDAAGRKLGGQVQIIADRDNALIAPDVSTGGFVAAWINERTDTPIYRNVILAQRFSASSAPISGQLEVITDDPDNSQSTTGYSELGGVMVDGTGEVVVSFKNYEVLSDLTTVTDGITDRDVYAKDQVLVRHLSVGATAFGPELQVAAADREAHFVTDTSGNTTSTRSGQQVWATSPQVIGAGEFLLPYVTTDYPQVDYTQHWFARTLAPAPVAADPLFSQVILEEEGEEQPTEVALLIA